MGKIKHNALLRVKDMRLAVLDSNPSLFGPFVGSYLLLCHGPLVGFPTKDDAHRFQHDSTDRSLVPLKEMKSSASKAIWHQDSQKLSTTEGWDASPQRGCHHSTDRWDPDGMA